ncbi:hypothetical protein V1517DRAFT_88887 [Lipomyces orientalis]|uniref:Uncharacterized protein n=1 Tax=Lipomyces orientalis TaxID=1233043 RepID=A0ACC3TRB4_9ASCO
MPKERHTCTRCSMRRQKCDRKDPCTRCVQNNEGSTCTRKWPDVYDPRIHRTYPKSKAAQAPPGTSASTNRLESNTEGVVPQNGARDASCAQNVATTPRAFQSQPVFPEITNMADCEDSIGTTLANDARHTSANGCQLSRQGSEPTSVEFRTNGIVKPSNFDPNSIQSLMDLHVGTARSGNSSGLSRGADLCPGDVQTHHLQTLIPSSRQILQLVEHHDAYLLWYHDCFHGPAFRMELSKAMHASDGLQLKSLDLRWCALLFAIMAASLACTSDLMAHSWGFPKVQKRLMSKYWYKATISCLYLADYTSKPHVYSIQAIQVLTMSAHTIGFSNEQFILFGAALRIAQSLGLQRLAHDPELDSFTANNAGTSQFRKELLIKRETGRRIWTRMCIYDWFSIPSSEMYFINKQHFTTIRPHRVDDETMILAGDQVPLGTDVGEYLYDIASLMAEFHDSVSALMDPVAKYEQVLKYDSKLRALGPESLPQSFSTEVAEASRPQWVLWARGVASITHAHKIIVIHRSFLGKSFTDPRFAYTRWASVAASKTILREVEAACADLERPAFWTDQSHTVGAGITLCLDILHRSQAEPEFAEHRKLVDQAVSLLGRYDDSTLALRGVRLLSSLLKDGRAKLQQPKHRACYDKENKAHSHEGEPLAWPLENRQSIDAVWTVKKSNSGDDGALSTASTAVPVQGGTQLRNTPSSPIAGDAVVLGVPVQYPNDFSLIDANGSFGTTNDNGVLSGMSWTDLFSDYFPAHSGFENAVLIEDLFK